MPYEFADAVLVPFPFTSQFRPSPTLGEVWLDQWQAAGLLKPSAIKPVFATLEQTLIIKQLGALLAADQAGLKNAITRILG
jgi:mRNA interferase MazF